MSVFGTLKGATTIIAGLSGEPALATEVSKVSSDMSTKVSSLAGDLHSCIIEKGTPFHSGGTHLKHDGTNAVADIGGNKGLTIIKGERLYKDPTAIDGGILGTDESGGEVLELLDGKVNLGSGGELDYDEEVKKIFDYFCKNIDGLV